MTDVLNFSAAGIKRTSVHHLHWALLSTVPMQRQGFVPNGVSYHHCVAVVSTFICRASILHCGTAPLLRAKEVFWLTAAVHLS